ncbi:hypothetical protein [Pseudomonas sp. UMAB-08]|uniref:hypothetical protein n=1 Tax=Pseudomonas sp. UMAB-08 TaxID=1365375 RepID=UPI001C599974|nr:hypothetical protein [Pseudomonas sp. UMAB-08]
MTDERLKIWLSFAKFLLGTFAIGVVTTLINAKFQAREITLKEQEHLSKFVDTALGKDLGPRLLMARYFANVTQSEALKSGWNNYLASLEAEFKNKTESVVSARKRLGELESEIENAGGAVKLAKLQELRTVRETLIEAEGELDPRGRLIPSAALDIVTQSNSQMRQMKSYCGKGMTITITLDSDGIPEKIVSYPKILSSNATADQTATYKEYVNCTMQTLKASDVNFHTFDFYP